MLHDTVTVANERKLLAISSSALHGTHIGLGRY